MCSSDLRYAALLPAEEAARCVFHTQKMVLGVGAKECAFLRERFERFSPHFPAMQLLEADAIATWEPAVALCDGKPRPEEILAIGIRDDATAVDYEELAASFVGQARDTLESSGRGLDLRLGTTVTEIRPEGADPQAPDSFLVSMVEIGRAHV